FIRNPELSRHVGKVDIDGIKSLYISYPIKITNPNCLACHSSPQVAPQSMVDIYGDKGGFG
ncbi:MAG: DUF3365 domain-containing protein, partial [Gammaproteobacteria bacterium]|nr:DUF3365 domain-containing protein [Gammaproteobacteria bacterium]